MSSRTITSGSTAQPTTKPQTQQTAHTGVPHEKISMRAYHKWVQRGCPQGTEKQDWHEAETELKAEMNKSCSTTGTSGQQQQRR